jgi:septum site-determining protein MinD
MARTILVLSGKGGSGKTTVAANLATVLNDLGKTVVVADGNLTTPNLGLHLGTELDALTLHDVLKGQADILDAMKITPSGLRVLPASVSVDDLKGLDPDQLGPSLSPLHDQVDYIIIDGAAGLGNEALAGLKAADEVIVVTNPEIPAVTDALKVIKLAEEAGVEVTGIVVNRVKGKRHELTNEDITSLLDEPILAEIPEDDAVAKAISRGEPVTMFSPNSSAALDMRNLAGSFVGQRIQLPFWTRLKNMILGRPI